jgi:methylmalonyl-CoA mutase, N-terminal domain
VRADRDADAHARAVNRLHEESTRAAVNLMPAIVEAVQAYATIGEMCGVLREVFGEYREPLAV